MVKCCVRIGVLAILVAMAAPVTAYFEELRKGIERGDPQTFLKVQRLSATTPPGERLEDLAELTSIFVRTNPEAFLRMQDKDLKCFGVDFMDDRFVDAPAARAKEKRLRMAALNSVSDPSLDRARRACLAELGK